MRINQNKREKLNRADLSATNAWRLRLSIRKKYSNLLLVEERLEKSPVSYRLYPVSVDRMRSLRSRAFLLFHSDCESTGLGQH